MLLKLRRFQFRLHWLASADSSPLDLGTRYFVENSARQLVARECDVTVVSTTNYSYATTFNPSQPLIDEWGNGIPVGEPDVVVIFIPRREEQSGLLHPLIVHEIGHAVDSRHGCVDAILDGATTRKLFPNKFERAVEDLARDLNAGTPEAEAQVEAMLESWVAEAFCDSLATLFLGPTYLYSFLVEVGSASLDEPSPSHPTSRQRIRAILRTLDQLGWSETMRKRDEDLDDWIRGLAAPSPHMSGVWGFLEWSIEDLRAVIRSEARKRVGSLTMKPPDERLDQVAELLAWRIPPSQVAGKSISRRDVILESWYSAIDEYGGSAVGLAQAADSSQLANLLPAALELCALVESWEAT